jgi:hypothetical protein
VSDPVLALAVVAVFFAACLAVRYFRTLDPQFWEAARTPLIGGAVAGVLVLLLELPGLAESVVMALLLTAAALYSRLTGSESEPVDGMLLGGLSGAVASLAFVIAGDDPLRAFSGCVLAGSVAGFGITFAALHVSDKVRQIIWDVVTAGVAVGAAALPALLGRFGAEDRHVAFGTAALVPLTVVAAVFRQWPDVRAELRHEASLGFMADEDVRATAHPLLRLGRGGWADGAAHRQFVRIASRIALRKRQQRSRSDEMARLYQLEVMKLRMALQEMTRIEHAASRAGSGGELPSDTMRASE